MAQILFLPGILGSELKLGGRTIWPPPICNLFSDAEVDRLKASGVSAGNVIRRIGILSFYDKLLDALKSAINQHGQHQLVEWPYDWRLDLADTSDRFRDALAQVPPAEDIIVIAHSMGGLVARGCLEDPANRNAAWLPRVKLAIFLATPHAGAIDALATILGLSAAPGLTKRQSARLNNDPGYPACYQLLPDLPAPVLWSGPAFDVEDFAADASWRDLGINLAVRPVVKAFRRRLDPGRRPANCRYTAVASAAHTTSVHMTRPAAGQAYDQTALKRTGDGTVPITSATALGCQTHYVTGTHLGVTQSSSTHAFVIALLGFPQTAWFAATQAAATYPTLSISPQFLEIGDRLEIVLKPAQPGPLHGKILFHRVKNDGELGEPFAMEVEAPVENLEAVTIGLSSAERFEPGQYQAVYSPSTGEPSNEIALIIRPQDAGP